MRRRGPRAGLGPAGPRGPRGRAERRGRTRQPGGDGHDGAGPDPGQLARATARLSSALPIFERPPMSSLRALAMSSSRVGSSPLRTALASLPSAVRVRLGRFFRVCLDLAPLCAFLTFRLAAAPCFAVAMALGYPATAAADARSTAQK